MGGVSFGNFSMSALHQFPSTMGWRQNSGYGRHDQSGLFWNPRGNGRVGRLSRRTGRARTRIHRGGVGGRHRENDRIEIRRFFSNTSVLHAAADAGTARAPTSILGGELQTDPKTQGGKLRNPLGSWNKLVHHRGYEGSFIEFSGPVEEPILMEVCSPQEDPDGKGSLLRGWEYAPTESSNNRRSPRLGATGRLWGDPVITRIMITPSCQRHVHLAAITRKNLSDTDRRITLVGEGRKWYWMTTSENQHRAPKDYYPATENEWRVIHPFGIDYREDSSKPDIQDLIVRFDDTSRDLTDSIGTWDEKCVEKEDGQDTVLSYSDGSTKDCGTAGPRACHVNGCSLA